MRVYVLISIILLQILVLLRLLPQDPMTALRLQRSAAASQGRTSPYAAELRGDPPLGMEMPESAVGAAIRSAAAPTRTAYMIVPVGDCAGCLATDLALWQSEALKANVSLVLLSSASPDKARKFRDSLHLTTPVVSDPEQLLLRRLNVVWLARPYLFSPNWNLVWMPSQRQIMYNPFHDDKFNQALQTARQGGR